MKPGGGFPWPEPSRRSPPHPSPPAAAPPSPQGEGPGRRPQADPEHFNTEGWRRPTARGTQKERHAYSVSFFLVEAGRVELPSENPSMGTSPGADGYCGSLALPVPVTLGKPSRPGVW